MLASERYQLHRAYKDLFSKPGGQAVLADICGRILGEGQPLFSTDSAILAGRAARRDAALEIRGMVDGTAYENNSKPEVKTHGGIRSSN